MGVPVNMRRGSGVNREREERQSLRRGGTCAHAERIGGDSGEGGGTGGGSCVHQEGSGVNMEGEEKEARLGVVGVPEIRETGHTHKHTTRTTQHTARQEQHNIRHAKKWGYL